MFDKKYLPTSISDNLDFGSDWINGTASTGDSQFAAQYSKYDGVPYTSNDFNSKATCPSKSGSIENYADSQQVYTNHCLRLVLQ